MPSPLDVLGGLGQIGGLGAIGAYQGEIEGKKLQKDFETRDLENQMRILRNTQLQQSLGPQYEYDAQGRIVLIQPGQPPRMVGELPQTQYGQQRVELLQQQARFNEQRADLAAARLKLLEEGGGRKKTDLETYRDFLSRGDRQGAQQFLQDLASVKAAEAAPPKPSGTSHFSTDAQGNVTEIRPDGTTRSYGKIGKPEKPEKPTEAPLGTARFLTKGVAEALTAKGIDPRSATPDQIAAAKQAAKADREKSAIEQTRARLEMGQAEKAVTAIEKSEDQLQGVEDLANRQEELAKRLAGELGGSWGTAVRTPLYALARHAPVGSKLQDTLGAFETINGQFAKVALGVEGLTSTGRIAVQNVQRALAFHAKENEPLSTQLERVGQLRRVVAETRAQLQAEKVRERTRIETLAPRAQPPSQEGGLIDLGDQ